MCISSSVISIYCSSKSAYNIFASLISSSLFLISTTSSLLVTYFYNYTKLSIEVGEIFKFCMILVHSFWWEYNKFVSLVVNALSILSIFCVILVIKIYLIGFIFTSKIPEERVSGSSFSKNSLSLIKFFLSYPKNFTCLVFSNTTSINSFK